MAVLKNQDGTMNFDVSNRLNNILIANDITNIEKLIESKDLFLNNEIHLGEKTKMELKSLIAELNIVNEQDVKIFLFNDGKEYYDELIADFNASVRVINSLKKINIEFLSELFSVDDYELKKIPSLGEKTFIEIKRLKRTVIKDLKLVSPSVEEDDSKKIIKNTYEIFVKNMDFPNTCDYNLIYSEVKKNIERFVDFYGKCDCFDFLKDDNFVNQLYFSEYILKMIKNLIFNILEDEINGLEFNLICNKINVEEKVLKKIIDNMIENNEVKCLDERYVIFRKSIVEVSKKLLKEKDYDILVMKLDGKTLQEIGDIYGVTRERIRQSISKSKAKIKEKVSEDTYSYLITNYDISREDFLEKFKDNYAYNYCSIFCDFSERKTLEDSLSDEKLPISFRKKCEKIIYKNYIIIGNEYVKKNINDLLYYLIKKNSKTTIPITDVYESYNLLLEDLSLKSDEKFHLSIRNIEAHLLRFDEVLWKGKKSFKFYPIKNYDFSELLSAIDLDSYSNIELSTLKFIRQYPQLMSEYDILDEYELHNLLKKIYVGSNEVNFIKMPTIRIGVCSSEKQMVDLYTNLSPITKKEFSEKYSDIYGMSEDTVLGRLKSVLDSYLVESEISHELIEQINLLDLTIIKSVLKSDFYDFYELNNIIKNNIKNINEEMFNSYLYQLLGFKTFTNYVIKEKYNSAIEYFMELITEKDVFDSNLFDRRYRKLMTFTSVFFKLKTDYKIIEYLPNKFINFSVLQKNDVTLEMIDEFKNEVYKFVGNKTYFTMESIIKSGFFHSLFDLGFDNCFYLSILTQGNKELSYKNMCKNKLMIYGVDNYKLVDFIESVVIKEKDLSIEIYDLIELMKNKYNLHIERYKIPNYIKDSSLYYNEIYDKIFLNYDVYFEEV
ncbi:MAG: DNA-directed RNA polymerase subunit alpha C-terminal domain-containing protein [bacterium]